MEDNKLSRRDFLRVSAMTAAGATLAACGATEAPPEPTEAPAAAAQPKPRHRPLCRRRRKKMTLDIMSPVRVRSPVPGDLECL